VSRFFKSAAFPILIVVVLAFFAQKLISAGERQQDPLGDARSERLELLRVLEELLDLV
jgi:hypothetical protein